MPRGFSILSLVLAIALVPIAGSAAPEYVTLKNVSNNCVLVSVFAYAYYNGKQNPTWNQTWSGNLSPDQGTKNFTFLGARTREVRVHIRVREAGSCYSALTSREAERTTSHDANLKIVNIHSGISIVND